MYDAIEKGIPIPEKYLALYNQSCSNEWYRKTISKKMANASTLKLTAGRDMLLSVNDSAKEFDQIISSYKHKLILIDFWASCCMPCREEMPSSEKLRNLYKDKNIVFLYVSIDKNVEAWKHAAKEEGLNDATNFLFLNPDNSPFCKQYNITTIPRYMLLGKDGKIINSDCPRPSTHELKFIIGKYLQE
jgi:thiol-disulfide isomerase/thioredoxin